MQTSSENATAQDSVTSSDFDKFLAERAAAADSLPLANENSDQSSSHSQTPRHRQIKKEERDSMFAL